MWDQFFQGSLDSRPKIDVQLHLVWVLPSFGRKSYVHFKKQWNRTLNCLHKLKVNDTHYLQIKWNIR